MEMQITRKLGGEEYVITLTDAEIVRAHRLRERRCDMLDLYHKINNMIGSFNDWDAGINCDDDAELHLHNVTLTGKKLKEIATPKFMDDLVDLFRNALGQDDSYWDLYWSNAECVVEEAIEEAMKEEN